MASAGRAHTWCIHTRAYQNAQSPQFYLGRSSSAILVEQYQHLTVCEGDGRAAETAREFELASARARLGQDAVAVGEVVPCVVLAHPHSIGRVLSAQALGREDGLTVGLVVPFAVRLVGGHSTRRYRYLKIIKVGNRTGRFAMKLFNY